MKKIDTSKQQAASRRGWKSYLKAVARKVLYYTYRRPYRAPQGSFASFRRHQAEGREWAYIRKALRAAKAAGGSKSREAYELTRLQEAKGFKLTYPEHAMEGV